MVKLLANKKFLVFVMTPVGCAKTNLSCKISTTILQRVLKMPTGINLKMNILKV